MKLVISTQHRENYGAHDWDGVGECPQYWKFKGGDTYVVSNVTVEQAMSSEFYDMVVAHIEYSSERFEEYVLGSELVDDIDYVESKYVAEWDSIIHLTVDGDKITAHRTRENDEYGYMRKEIRRCYESWTQGLSGDRQDYQCSYEFVNGMILPSLEAHEYIQQLAA